jgi:hypothetical protein
MQASAILMSVAILLLAATIWDDLRSNGRVTPLRKTYLLVASIFAFVCAVVQVVF